MIEGSKSVLWFILSPVRLLQSLIPIAAAERCSVMFERREL